MPSVVEYRRTLHRIPELDNDLPETTALVRAALERLHCTVTSPIRSSVCAFFDAGKPDTVAFRADLDALPETEDTGLSFSSQHPGNMHACGHDGHTAMALALAEWVNGRLPNLPRNVLFLFQPSEETTGGAGQLCATGILERHRVRRIFGLHLWPGLPQGAVWAKPGPQMARSSEVTVRITGRSVHISRWQEGYDALLAAVRLVDKVYAAEREILPPEEPRVLRFGKLTSGDVRNAVSGHTELLGSMRSFSDGSFSLLKKKLTEVCREVEAETLCTVNLHISEGYPPVWNHEELFEKVCTGLGPDAPALLPAPALAAEDFSFYQQYVPGIFFFLGVGDTAPLHATNFSFDDEAVLPRGVEFLEKLALLP